MYKFQNTHILLSTSYNSMIIIKKVQKNMFCKECGFELPDNSKFCPNCGQSVATEKQPETLMEKPDFMALAEEEYNQKPSWKKSFSKSIRQKEIRKIAKQMEKSWELAHNHTGYTCPKCSAIVNKTDLTCSECGCGLELTICNGCGREFMNKRNSKTGLCPKCKMLTLTTINIGLNQLK